jgi:hypothetical protein
MRSLIIFTAFFQIAASALAQGNSPQNINGVFPNLSIVGANTNRSESGIGALLPWADKLWMVGYVAHISGSRIGLYEISENMTMIKRPESITGTFANRMVHTPSEQGLIVPDFCFWRGMFVMAGDQTDKGMGQPQSGLLFQNIDDLWGYGKPQGWGDVWQDDTLSSGQESDPFLMTGFDKKIIHFKNYGNQKVKFKIEIDFQGNNTWSEYKTVSVLPGAYQFEIFPDGYSAHWVRVTVDKTTVATVGFMYN